MSVEDKQVIEMTNSSAERRRQEAMERAEALRCERNYRKRIRQQRNRYQRRVLLALIPTLLCMLMALVLVASIAAGWNGGRDAAWAAAIAVVLAFAGGLRMAKTGK